MRFETGSDYLDWRADVDDTMKEHGECITQAKTTGSNAVQWGSALRSVCGGGVIALIAFLIASYFKHVS
jgi:hypothetical protein